MAEGDDLLLAEYAGALADAIEVALPAWVVRSVEQAAQAAGLPADDELRAAAVAAGERCRAEVAPQVRALLMSDLDTQRSTPLALLRAATSYATAVLAAAGVPEVPRDEFDVRAFPADVYALSPASFADVDESLREPGLVWGAAKAHVHLARHRPSGAN